MQTTQLHSTVTTDLLIDCGPLGTTCARMGCMGRRHTGQPRAACCRPCQASRRRQGSDFPGWRCHAADRSLMHEAVDEGVMVAGLVAVKGEHLAHLLAWAVQRGDTVETCLAMPYHHPSIEEMLQSALKDAAKQMAANRLVHASPRF